MKFYFDENFPKAGQDFAARLGIECFDHRGTADEGMADISLFEAAQKREAIIVTTDRDFYHTISVLNPKHYGIVVIALKKPNRQNLMDRLRWAIENFTEAQLRNRALSLRDNSWTARPPLD